MLVVRFSLASDGLKGLLNTEANIKSFSGPEDHKLYNFNRNSILFQLEVAGLMFG